MAKQSADYVAVPRKWCISHNGIMEEDEFCEHADSYETPCVLVRLYIEDPNIQIGREIQS